MASTGARRRPQKYPDELRERAVRMVLKVRAESGERHGAVTRVAKELGIGPESLRGWVNRAEIDSGRRPGTTSADAQRIVQLEREVRELRRANEMANSTGERTGPVTIRAPRSQEQRLGRDLTHEQKQLAFRLRARGWRLVDIAREIGCTAPMVGLMVRDGRFTTGVPDAWEPRPGCLTIGDREEILVGIRAGESLSSIARGLGHVPSVITREVAANGSRDDYSAWHAHQRAREVARRPKPCKLRAGRLLDEVTKRLEELWSPDEIARRYRWTSRTTRRCG